MTRKAGLWIDHRIAVIVFLDGKKNKIIQIKSNVEKQIQRATESRSGGPFESQAVPSDGRQQQKYTLHLNTYYNEVISYVRNADEIIIMGPGEAKGEFIKLLEQEGIGETILNVDAADKMTNSQIASKVRQYYLQ